jgi:FixJ family two-component response regulator
MTSSTVYIIDEDADIRLAMNYVLRPYHYKVQSYASAAHFLCQKHSSGPACLVVDLEISEMTELDLQDLLRRDNAHLSVIFVSSKDDIAIAVRAMKAGAIDFLTKPIDHARLLSAIEAGLMISEQARAKQEKLKKDQAAFVSLTRRERDVCLGIARGLLNKQVAFELGTSEATVKAQRAKMMLKLGAGSLPDVVRLVDELRTAGVIPTPSARPASSRSPLILSAHRPLHADANARFYSVRQQTG